MAHGQFIVSDVNPNDSHGGGGCVCDPVKQADCKPPYCVFYGNDMESAVSPHVVVCQTCLLRMNAAMGGESLSSGEQGQVVAGQPVEAQERRESPVVDDSELLNALKARDKEMPSI